MKFHLFTAFLFCIVVMAYAAAAQNLSSSSPSGSPTSSTRPTGTTTPTTSPTSGANGLTSMSGSAFGLAIAGSLAAFLA